MATKILVIGSPSGTAGGLPTLLPKLAALHSKQSFSFAIILGDLFPPPATATDEETELIERLLRGELDVPLPTYFSVGRHELPEGIRRRLASAQGEGGEVCANLWFLGRRGVLVTSEGVRIVVLGGRLRSGEGAGVGEGEGEEGGEAQEGQGGKEGGEGQTGGKDDTTSPWYTPAEASSLKGANSADILLTYEWPEGLTRYSQIPIVPEGVLGTERLPGQSRHVRELARRLRPRYHFVAGAGEVFWEREPYRNEVVRGKERERERERGVGAQGPRATRVIALADWGNGVKVKSLYAFNLTIQDKPTAEPLPPNTTESPYAGLDGDDRSKKRALLETGMPEEYPAEVGANGSFFWGDRTQDQGREQRRGKKSRGGGDRGRGGGGGGGGHRPPPGPDTCFFCLSSPTLAKHLLVSIGSEAYLTTAKGPLTTPSCNPPGLPFPAHILIIPFAHTPTLELISDDPGATYAEMLRYRGVLAAMFTARGAGAVCWEVARPGGVHTHWQVVPVAGGKLGGVEGAFREAAGREGLGEFVLESDSGTDHPSSAGAGGGGYFRVWISGVHAVGEWMVLGLREGAYFDLQFGRRVVAGVVFGGAAGGDGEGGDEGGDGNEVVRQRANWRDCQQTVEEEARDARAFKEGFREWDFTL